MSNFNLKTLYNIYFINYRNVPNYFYIRFYINYINRLNPQKYYFGFNECYYYANSTQ